jgi:hypothetical protein
MSTPTARTLELLRREGWLCQTVERYCPHSRRRIDPAFLAEERAVLGDRIYSREYECVFSAADDAAFDPLAIERALAAVGSGPPLF